MSQEQILLDPMFEVPGSNIHSVTITKDCVTAKSPPQYGYHSNGEHAEESHDPTPPPAVMELGLDKAAPVEAAESSVL